MKKILAFLFTISLFYFVGAQGVLAASNHDVEIRTYLDSSNMNLLAPGLTEKARGSKIQFPPSGISSEYSFAYFAVNDIVRDDLPFTHEFVVRSNMKITAIYHPNGSVTPANARHVVVFADSKNQIIDVQYIVDGEDAIEPTAKLPVLPPFAKYAATKWLTSDNISDLTNIESNRVYFLQYEVDTVTNHTVTVTNGTGSGSYLYNTVVTAIPNSAPEAQVFSHWVDAEGNVLSYNSNYKFTVLSNVSITAVYAASASPVPVVNMSDALSLRDNFVSYKGQFSLPAGFTLVEYGFIFSRSSDVLTLDSLGATIVPSNVHNGATGEFLRSFPNDTFNSVRAYLIVKNASNIEEVEYSDNFYRSVSTLGEAGNYLASFDTETKGSYGISSVTVNGISWTLDDALIAADTNKIGAQSVRNRGSIYTNSGFANISTITFKAAKYGSDSDNSIIISVSKDGSTWVNVSDGLGNSNVTSTTLIDYTFTLSNSVNFANSALEAGDVLRFKITVGTLGQRINLDEISVNYGAYNGPIHEITLMTETTNTQLIAEGSPVSNPADKTGYTFVGWYLDSIFNDSYENNGVIESLTLYAKYAINNYTITFNYNGADGGQTTPTITAEYNSEVTLPVPTKTGYDFGGWESSTGITQYPSPYTIEASNRSMYAKWVINDLGKATADAASISLPLNINDNNPLTLALSGSNGSTISWSSDTPTIISTNGTVNLPTEEPVIVKLTATVNSNGQIVIREFNITVNPESSAPDPIVLRQSDFGTTNNTTNQYSSTITLNVNNGSLDSFPTSNSNWTVKGANFNSSTWDYVRMGGTAASTVENLNVYMKTNYALAGTVTRIVLNIIALDSASGSEIIYLQTSSDGTNWSSLTSLTISATGNLTFEGLNIVNSYYRFVFERASTGTNKGTDIKTITFYGNPS